MSWASTTPFGTRSALPGPPHCESMIAMSGALTTPSPLRSPNTPAGGGPMVPSSLMRDAQTSLAPVEPPCQTSTLPPSTASAAT